MAKTELHRFHFAKKKKKKINFFPVQSSAASQTSMTINRLNLEKMCFRADDSKREGSIER